MTTPSAGPRLRTLRMLFGGIGCVVLTATGLAVLKERRVPTLASALGRSGGAPNHPQEPYTASEAAQPPALHTRESAPMRGGFAEPRKIKNVLPVLPPGIRSRDGVVIIEITVGTDGAVNVRCRCLFRRRVLHRRAAERT